MQSFTDGFYERVLGESKIHLTQAKWGTVNAGTHIFHTGGQYESYLFLPETTI